MVTDVFLNQKRVNVCEHTTNMGCERGRDGGKFKRKLSEVNTRAVSRGQNELIGKFKIVVGNVISITSTFQQELKGTW